jgi:hypothetical protein
MCLSLLVRSSDLDGILLMISRAWYVCRLQSVHHGANITTLTSTK